MQIKGKNKSRNPLKEPTNTIFNREETAKESEGRIAFDYQSFAPAAQLRDVVLTKAWFTLRGLSKDAKLAVAPAASPTGGGGFVACCSSSVLRGRRGKCCPTNAGNDTVARQSHFCSISSKTDNADVPFLP